MGCGLVWEGWSLVVVYRASDFVIAGSPGLVRGSASAWSGFGVAASSASVSIGSVVSGGASGFIGPEGDQYRSALSDDLRPELEVVFEAWSKVGSALSGFASELESLQSRMAVVAADAVEARGALESARSALTSAQQADAGAAKARGEAEQALQPGEELPPDTYDDRAPAAQARVVAAEEALQGCVDMAAGLRAEHVVAVRTCRLAIDYAKDLRFEEPPGWLESAFDSVVDWIAEHADVLKAIADVLNTISMVAGMLSFIPGMAAVALIAGAAALVINVVVMAATGEWDVVSLAFDVVGLIPGGKLLGKGADAAKYADEAGDAAKYVDDAADAAKYADDAADATKYADDAVPTSSRPGCGDPIDPITGAVFLEQTDLVLPGTLPLRITRTHISSYRYGRGFGRTWASTLDQRIVRTKDGDAAAILEDGSTLYFRDAWESPVGAPMLPVAGPRRWSLTRSVDGGFELHDPVLLITREFGAARETGTDAAGTATAVITRIVDRNGNAITFEYSGELLSAVTHSGGYRVQVSSSGGRHTGLTVTDSDASDTGIEIRRFGYNHRGELVSVTDSSGLDLTFAYDDAGRMAGWVDRNGLWFNYRYDDQGRCVQNGGRDGALRYGFEYFGSSTRVTDSLGAAQTYRYDPQAHRLLSHIDALGNETQHEYDEWDRVTRTTDPLGNVTGYEYDDSSAVTRTWYPDGTSQQVVRDQRSLPVRVVSADGAVWAREFDVMGNLVAETDPTGARTSYSYDSRGGVRTETNAVGGVSHYDRDAAGLPVRVTDATGGWVAQRYDRLGNPIEVTDSEGESLAMVWSPDGRLVRSRDAAGAIQSWEWDAEGNLLRHRSESGAVTSYEIGVWDLPVARVDPSHARYQFDYDTELRLRQVRNPEGLTWTYDYDPAGRVAAETDFTGRTTRFEHDAAGRLIAVTTARGERLEFTLDPCGNQVQRRTPEGLTDLRYDPMGRLVAADSPGVRLRIERDAVGRVIAETVNAATVRSRLDLLGERVERITPTGLISGYVRDLASRVRAISTGGHRVTIDRDSLGREQWRRFAAGTDMHTARDLSGRVVQQGLRTASGTAQLTGYRYRPDGLLTDVERDARLANTYRLDAAGRVLQARSAMTPGAAAPWQWLQEDYDYSPAGRVSSSDSGPRQYRAIQVTKAGRNTYGWDRDGRMTTRSTARLSQAPAVTRFRYDSCDQLVEAIVPDGSRWVYRYDALGRRVGKAHFAPDGTELGTVTATWDGDVLIEEVIADSDGQTVRAWEYSPDDEFRPIVQHTVTTGHSGTGAPDVAVVVTDLTGTPTELRSPDGELVLWHAGKRTIWDHELADPAHGNRTNCPLRFAGQYRDDETQLNYNRNRYYDPASNSYLTLDPIGLEGGLDPYNYVPNPTGWIDPLGLAPCGKYDVGTYQDLKKTSAGTGLDIHHVGQQAVMPKLMKGGEVYDPRTAPSIAVPRVGHTRRLPGGEGPTVSRNTTNVTTARDLLARDIRELRRVYPDIPNSKLLELIKLNKDTYPLTFAR